LTESELTHQVRLALATLEKVKHEVDVAIETISGKSTLTQKEINALKQQPTPSDDELVSQQLQATVGQIAKSVNDLTDRQSKAIVKVKKTGYLTAIGLALDLILTVVIFFLADANDRTSERLEEVQARTSEEVLCPLYDLFLTSYNPNGPTAKRDPAGYERSMVTIEKGAVALGCAHTKRGKK